MSETIETGILQRDVDAIDALDDDAFRRLVADRIEPCPDNRAIWKVLSHPELLDRAAGCLEELAEELGEAIASRALGPKHHKAKVLSFVHHRLHQLDQAAKSAALRAEGHISPREREKQALRALVRQLTLAIDGHRRECARLDLSAEPHDVALWDVLDVLTLPRDGDVSGPTLSEVIVAGHWRHPEEVSAS